MGEKLNGVAGSVKKKIGVIGFFIIDFDITSFKLWMVCLTVKLRTRSMFIYNWYYFFLLKKFKTLQKAFLNGVFYQQIQYCCRNQNQQS